MRWLVLACVILAARPATGRVVRWEPFPMRECPRGNSWDAIARCLTKHGQVAVERQLPRAKVVYVKKRERPHTFDESGLFLYVQRDGAWKLGGMLLTGSRDAEVLGFQVVTLRGQTGYRVDLGEHVATSVQPDQVTMLPAVMRTRTALFCRGAHWQCTRIVTACDVLVHGHTVWTFRGELEIKDTEVHVHGDRSKAGSMCPGPDRVHLHWPED